MPRFDTQKVCLVTGGASGLGRATTINLAKYGNTVVIGDLNEEAGRETVAEIKAAGGSAHFQLLDVTDRKSVEAFVGEVVDRFGRLDCAVNNAGVEGERHNVADYPDDEWQRVIDINLTGVFTCMKHELKVMSAQGSGSIVNVGSTGSLRGIGLMSAYVSSKHALVGLTKSAALEYAARHVRINVLCPGGFHTPMSDRLYKGDFSGILAGTPMGRIAPAEEIAQVIVWLCSDEASFVTGAAYQVDGGRMAGPVLPG
ncbi:glucose 1-dehydrogenase [Chelativorans sp. Marseille-P2723]|uniref:SDR family NAD(P)-dependent oxidoreductase n=1 Tax=Chelativorans sp. Marseille-P2723 TaxID=2709133 RepID=UPI00156EC0EF|nr:glucose 1-dehydrogenase [Chelativorans sp. Marseille-P2723]